MSAIVVTDLYKSFKNHEVLKGITFSAEQGEVIALLGSSGSGKSTLLRCINQLEVPDRGRIEVANRILEFDLGKKPISQKTIIHVRTKVGMVFQQFNLWAHLTVLQNLITAPIYVLHMKESEAVKRAEYLLQKVGILNKQHQYPAQLSGGQQQRAAIARALMMQPSAMLFDEPTSSLDPEMVGEVLQTMKALAKEGMTMIVASHEMGFAREVASQLIFLHEGRILERGPAQEIFRQPKTERLRKFLESVRH
jgi:ABC-type histidine transport system ATPase subunit